MIAPSYDTLLVILSYIISVIGSYTALELATNIRGATTPRAKFAWLAGAAIAMGGGAIWAMHFIGMLAYILPIGVSYDVALTGLSLIIAVGACGAGLFLVSAKTASVAKLLIAGAVTGLGVAGMHYTGMAAMIMPASISYSMLLVSGSIAIAIAAATIALWLAFNLRGLLQRVASACVMGLAVCGMHYTGMAAVTMAHKPMDVSGTVISNQTLAFYTFVLVAVIMILLTVVSLFKSAPEPV